MSRVDRRCVVHVPAVLEGARGAYGTASPEGRMSRRYSALLQVRYQAPRARAAGSDPARPDRGQGDDHHA